MVGFREGTLAQIRDSKYDLRKCGLSLDEIWQQSARPQDPEEVADERDRRARKALQKTTRNALLPQMVVDAGARMRHKLERWNLGGFPRDTSDRFLRALKVVTKYLPPSIGAAVIRASWNGCCTAHRFQRRGQCVFQCKSYFKPTFESQCY